MAPLLVAMSWCQPLRASSWDEIGSYLRLIQKTGVEALVANDCPQGLLGAFHEGRQALLMCGNNLPDDPAYIWVVLAHESAHVIVCMYVSPSALRARDFPPVVPEQKAEQSSPMVPTRLVLAYSGARSPPRAAWARVRAQAPHVLR